MKNCEMKIDKLMTLRKRWSSGLQGEELSSLLVRREMVTVDAELLFSFTCKGGCGYELGGAEFAIKNGDCFCFDCYISKERGK